MLVTTSNPTNLDAAGQHQGLPVAGLHAAQPASITPFNPAWADQSALALQRIPKLPAQPDFMCEAFKDTRFPHQPTRRTLADTIKVFAACGYLSAEQGQWLAENKQYPNRLWAAIEGMAPSLANDPSQAISKSLNEALIDLYPIMPMARFVSAWAKHLPDCIDESLVHALNRAYRYCQADDDQRNPWDFDLPAIEAGMRKTLRAIAATLNERTTPARIEGRSHIESSIGFAEHLTLDSPLIVGADHMEGIEINLNPAHDCPDSLWSAVKMALKLIQQHLMPMTLSPDILDLHMMMYEEAEEDVVLIQNYLDAHGKDYDDLAAVDDAIDALRPELYYLEDPHHYQEASEARTDRAATEDRWRIAGSVSTENLKQALSAASPANQREQRIAHWCQQVLLALPEIIQRDAGEKWWERVERESNNTTCPNLLDEFTPVWLDCETSVYNTLNDQHIGMMQSGEDTEPLELAWSADPAEILHWCDKMRLGMTLLSDLYHLSAPENTD